MLKIVIVTNCFYYLLIVLHKFTFFINSRHTEIIINFIIKYEFINIFIIQREKCENSNGLFKHIYRNRSQ